MSRPFRCAPIVAAFALITVVACGKTDSSARQPLGTPTNDAVSAPSGASGPQLPLAAMNALEAGNVAYRAKQYDAALAKYREAAVAAPAHAAPWFGMYMVANEMKNTPLADSAMANVKGLSADPAALGAHAKVASEMTTEAGRAGHPSATPDLPAGHPTTQPLPLGHPAPTPPLTPRRQTDSSGRGRA